MKRKIKFLTTVTSLALVITILILGVSATVQRQVSISGQISFQIKNVMLDFEVYRAYGTISEENTEPTDYTQVGTKIEYRLGQSQQEERTISLGDVTLTDLQPSFKYMLKFKNAFSIASGNILSFTINQWTPTNGVQAKYRLGFNSIDD